jgi:hypothetical protein
MLPRRVEPLDDWLQAPVHARSADDRFQVRRASPADYAAIFELLDETFRDSRPASFNDWLYRRNPSGQARCWVTVERATGALVANETRWPWPFARGREALRGEMIGDAAVAPRFQRQDVGDLRAPFRRAHPWYSDTTAISWPNEESRRAAIKHGYGSRIFGPIPRATLPLNMGAILDARLPAGLRWARSPLSTVAHGLLAARERVFPGLPRFTLRPLSRFDSAFDGVTEACMSQTEYWSPHSWRFLNWRYLDHPTHSYAAIAAVRGADPAGYAVIRLDGKSATLMEFAAPQGEDECRRALLVGARELAREAGCVRMEFFSTESWRHWSFLRRAGFTMRPSGWWAQARGPVERPISVWQLTPGDTDFL